MKWGQGRKAQEQELVWAMEDGMEGRRQMQRVPHVIPVAAGGDGRLSGRFPAVLPPREVPMNENEDRRRGIVHDADTCGVAVRCSLGSFARFDRWIDGQLAQLVRRWAHVAAPVDRDREARIRGARPW